MGHAMIRARIAEDESERRQLPRLPVELEAKMRELGSEGVEARVLNISDNGFMADADADFQVGTRIWLMLPGGGRANSVVRWTAGSKLCAELAEPISLTDVSN
jgi:hypothetical protein